MYIYTYMYIPILVYIHTLFLKTHKKKALDTRILLRDSFSYIIFLITNVKT